MKLVHKKCLICGEVFLPKSPRQKFCSKQCREKSPTCPRKSSQLCWKCRKATGFCSWSSNFVPVENWDADKVITKDGIKTYRIRACPLFVAD